MGQLEEGRALSFYKDARWGTLVAEAEYHAVLFDDEPVEGAAEMIESSWDTASAHVGNCFLGMNLSGPQQPHG